MFNEDLDITELRGIYVDAKIRSGHPYEDVVSGSPYQPNQQAAINRGQHVYEVRTKGTTISMNDSKFKISQTDKIELMQFVKASGDINSNGIPGILKEF